MANLQKIAADTVYLGVSDRRLAKFENLFPIPRGVSYNSYLIMGEKTALLDTVDASVATPFFEKTEQALEDRPLDYIVVNHMEPDHAATLGLALARWPKAQLVCNAKTLPMLRMYYPGSEEAIAGALVVKEGDTLPLGGHTLHFVMAPMVHWPEVMMSFDADTGVLFSADAFGTFGALAGNVFADEVDFARDWLPDARRYYANIVGKYGVPVQAVLKKAAGLNIKVLAPLHGPVWRKDLGWFLEKYDRWSRWQPEAAAVAIFYGSMYGNTEAAAHAVADALAAKGVVDIAMYDISVTDASVLIGEAFRVSHLVLACPTYNGGIYLPMASLLEDMKALALQGRTVALIENGSWAPMAAKLMATQLAEMKAMTVLQPQLTVRGALANAQQGEVDAMAQAVADSLAACKGDIEG